MSSVTLINATDRYEVRSKPGAAAELRTSSATAALDHAMKSAGSSSVTQYSVFDRHLNRVAVAAKGQPGLRGLDVWNLDPAFQAVLDAEATNRANKEAAVEADVVEIGVPKEARERRHREQAAQRVGEDAAMHERAEESKQVAERVAESVGDQIEAVMEPEPAVQSPVPGFLMRATEQESAPSADLDPLEDEPEYVALDGGAAPANEDAAVEGAAALPDKAHQAERELTAGERVIEALLADMKALDVMGLVSASSIERESAESQWAQLQAHAARVDRVFGGVSELGRQHLPARLADKLEAALQGAVASESELAFGSAPAGAQDADGTGVANVVPAQEADRRRKEVRPQGGDGGGSVLGTLLFGPLMLLRPAAGLVHDGAKASHEALRNAVAKRRHTAFDVMTGQLKTAAASIEADATWLRSHGMGKIADELRAAGLTPRDACAQMERGGSLEHLGLQARGLMADPEAQYRLERMSENMGRFEQDSQRLVKAGEAAGRDREVSAAVEPLIEQVGAAVDGMPVAGKDGKFSMLSDRFSEMAEKLKAMIDALISKFTSKL